MALRSAVRTSVGIGYPAHSAFSSAGGQLVRTRDELSQVSLIVAFALENATGRCPQPRRDPLSGLPDPPYDVSFDEPGVSSVFKRLYEPYCELQILFERDFGERLAATYEAHKHATGLRGNRGASAASSSDGVEAMNAALARALPLPLLLRIANRLFAKPFASEAHLSPLCAHPPPTLPPDAVLIRIAIRRRPRLDAYCCRHPQRHAVRATAASQPGAVAAWRSLCSGVTRWWRLTTGWASE